MIYPNGYQFGRNRSARLVRAARLRALSIQGGENSYSPSVMRTRHTSPIVCNWAFSQSNGTDSLRYTWIILLPALPEAEAIAALYEQDRVHHLGSFPDLEDEMCCFTSGGFAGGSPGRLALMAVASARDLVYMNRSLWSFDRQRLGCRLGLIYWVCCHLSRIASTFGN
jgi:hypothetical protein